MSYRVAPQSHTLVNAASAANPSPVPVNEVGNLTVAGSPVTPAAEVQTATLSGVAAGDVLSIDFRGIPYGFVATGSSNPSACTGLAQAFELGSYDTWHGVVASPAAGDLFAIAFQGGSTYGFQATTTTASDVATGLANAYTSGAFEVWKGTIGGTAAGAVFAVIVSGVTYQFASIPGNTTSDVATGLANAYTLGSYDNWKIAISGTADGTQTYTVTIPGDTGGNTGTGVWTYTPANATSATTQASELKTLIATTFPSSLYDCTNAGPNVILTKKARGAGVTITATLNVAGPVSLTLTNPVTGVAGAGASPWVASTSTADLILTYATRANVTPSISQSVSGGGSWSANMARTVYGCPVGGATPWVASASGAKVFMTAASRGVVSVNWTWSATGTGTLSQVHDVIGVAGAGTSVWTPTHPGSTVVMTYHTTGTIDPADDLTFAVSGSGSFAVVVSPTGHPGDLASCTDGTNNYTYAVQVGDLIADIVAGLAAALSGVGSYGTVDNNPVVQVTGPGPFADYATFTLTDNSTLQAGSTLALSWAVTTPAVQPLPTNPSPKVGGLGAGQLQCTLAGGLTSYKVDLWGWIAATGTWAAIAAFTQKTVTQATSYDVDLTGYDSVYAYVHTFVGTGTATVVLENHL